ncbi:MAG: transposase [Saprospiraceae bacterium]|nr:transposase [Saprospiraceae bacterium]
MKKTTKATSFEELVPDEELREKMKAHLYAKKSLFGEGSIFSDLLQTAVNGMLNGEMNDFIEEERAKDKSNKRNGHTKKVVRSMAGPLEIQTPRDRASDFEKDVRAVRQDLRAVYTATTRSAAELAMEAFDVKWKSKYADIAQSWRRDWDELMAFMDYPPAMQRMIYTTNPVEALHRIVRKLIKGKAAWVSDTALLKQLYLSLQHNEKSWKRKANGWKTIQRELIKLYGDRISKHLHDD